MFRASSDASSVGSCAPRGARPLIVFALCLASGCNTTRRDVARVEAPIGSGTHPTVAAAPPALPTGSAIGAGPLAGAGFVAPVEQASGVPVYGNARIPASADVVSGTPGGAYPAPAAVAPVIGATMPQQPYFPQTRAMTPMPAHGIVPVGAFPTAGTGSSFVPAPGFAAPAPRVLAPAGPIGPGRVTESSVNGFRYRPRTARGVVTRSGSTPFLSGEDLSGLRLRPKRVPLGVYGPGGRVGMPSASGEPLPHPAVLDTGPVPEDDALPDTETPSEQTQPRMGGRTGSDRGPSSEGAPEPTRETPASPQPDSAGEQPDRDFPAPGKRPKAGA